MIVGYVGRVVHVVTAFHHSAAGELVFACGPYPGVKPHEVTVTAGNDRVAQLVNCPVCRAATVMDRLERPSFMQPSEEKT